MTNTVFLPVLLFVLMGGLLERSATAKRMMLTAGALFGEREGGMAHAVVIVGALLALRSRRSSGSCTNTARSTNC